MFALSAAFEQGDFPLYAKLYRLVVAGFEVQAGVVFKRSPGAPIQGVVVEEIECAGNRLAIARRDDEQDVFGHG